MCVPNNNWMQYLDKLSNIIYLNIFSDLKMTNDELHYLSNLINLEFLVISGNCIADNDLKYLFVLSNLKTFHTSSGYITNNGIKHLTKLLKLEWLDVATCINVTGECINYFEIAFGNKRIEVVREDVVQSAGKIIIVVWENPMVSITTSSMNKYHHSKQ